jgi:hypothetical protein
MSYIVEMLSLSFSLLHGRSYSTPHVSGVGVWPISTSLLLKQTKNPKKKKITQQKKGNFRHGYKYPIQTVRFRSTPRPRRMVLPPPPPVPPPPPPPSARPSPTSTSLRPFPVPATRRPHCPPSLTTRGTVGAGAVRAGGGGLVAHALTAPPARKPRSSCFLHDIDEIFSD